MWCFGGDVLFVNRKGDEACFLFKVWAITTIVFVKSCNYTITIIGDISVEFAFLSLYPVFNEWFVMFFVSSALFP